MKCCDKHTCCDEQAVPDAEHIIGSGSPLWSLYDRLIGLVPKGIEVKDCLIGSHWVLVRSIGVGIAMLPPEWDRRLPLSRQIRGMELARLAVLLKSWHPLAAALGLAAVNSVVNAQNMVARNWHFDPDKQPEESIFLSIRREVVGKKVAVVGHFPDLAELAPVCRLSILERNPQPGDFPDPACEFILPEQDYVLITGTTLINKTLQRLLQLSEKAQVVLVGPSTPLTPLLFSEGVSRLAGTVVIEEDRVWQHVAEGGDKSIFQAGARMIKVRREDIRS